MSRAGAAVMGIDTGKGESTMTEKTELTRDEAIVELLTEARGIHERLNSISTWVAFGGVVLLLALILGACSVLFVGL